MTSFHYDVTNDAIIRFAARIGKMLKSLADDCEIKAANIIL